jgi:hypothetical protein
MLKALESYREMASPADRGAEGGPGGAASVTRQPDAVAEPAAAAVPPSPTAEGAA